MTDKPKSRLYRLASLRYSLERQIEDALSWGSCGTGDTDVDQKLALLCSAARYAKRLAASTDENELLDQIDLLVNLRQEALAGLWEYRRRIARESLWRRFRAWLGARTSSIGPP